jgi:hypothetical protein
MWEAALGPRAIILVLNQPVILAANENSETVPERRTKLQVNMVQIKDVTESKLSYLTH